MSRKPPGNKPICQNMGAGVRDLDTADGTISANTGTGSAWRRRAIAGSDSSRVPSFPQNKKAAISSNRV